MSQQEPELRNDLERRLAAMPVKDSGHGIANFHASQKAEPLSLTAEDSANVLILITSPERAQPCLDQLPGFDGGILKDARWTQQKMADGFGVGLEPDPVTQLAQMAAAEKTH